MIIKNKTCIIKCKQKKTKFVKDYNNIISIRLKLIVERFANQTIKYILRCCNGHLVARLNSLTSHVWRDHCKQTTLHTSKPKFEVQQVVQSREFGQLPYWCLPTLGSLNNSWFVGKGSGSVTSSPAAKIVLLRSAVVRASVSTDLPRPTFTNTHDVFILLKVSVSNRLWVSRVNGAQLTMKSLRLTSSLKVMNSAPSSSPGKSRWNLYQSDEYYTYIYTLIGIKSYLLPFSSVPCRETFSLWMALIFLRFFHRYGQDQRFLLFYCADRGQAATEIEIHIRIFLLLQKKKKTKEKRVN